MPRPPKPVVDDNNKTVGGLSFHKTSGRYYATYSEPRVYFGRDKTAAIVAFRAWEDAQTDGKVIIHDHHKIGVDDRPKVVRQTEDGWDRATPIGGDAFWSKIKELITNDPFLAAQKTGLPLDRLDSLPKPCKPISLTAALDIYLGKTNKISEPEIKQVKLAWGDFTDFVSVSMMDRIEKTQVKAWIEKLLAAYSQGTAKRRVYRIKTILRYAVKQDEGTKHCQDVLKWIDANELPRGRKLDPHPISRDDFKSLMRSAKGTVWEAMLLTALNCCYYSIDIIRLPISAVNLTDGTIIFRRQKKDTVRVAVLWDRTRKALAKVMKGRGDRHYVFETRLKGPWNSSAFCNAFVSIRGDLDVQFNHIRDGAYSAAMRGKGVAEKEARILAGHRAAGETDAYVEAHPDMVTSACEAIERHYFG